MRRSAAESLRFLGKDIGGCGSNRHCQPHRVKGYTMKYVALLLGTLLFSSSHVCAEPVLSPDTVKAWSIVCAPQATEPEHYAAEEFQTLFKEMSGVELPLVEAVEKGAAAVFVGPDAAAASGLVEARSDFKEEELRVLVSEKGICIDGGRPRGTLYGVYEFFEEVCGARFLTQDHTWFPAEVKMPLGQRSYNPVFSFRWSYYGENLRNPPWGARLRNNTLGGKAKFGGRTGYRLVSHNVAYLLPPATYGKEHPEYYALVDGQRKLEMGGGGPQLCVTNPEVLKLVVQAVRDEILKNPDAKNINIAQMDNGSFCTCENCAAIDAREESHAGAMLSFVNAVAEQIEQTNPEVLISTYAYQYTRKPPKTLRARPNVMIQLCSIECCDFHAIDDPACSLNRSFCEDTATWKQKCDHIFIWHYNTNFRGYELPFPNFRSIGRSVKYFADNNGQGVFMQAAGNGFSSELSDLRNYVMSRCLWKPGRDSWQEMEAFCRMHYAEAAQPILDYLAYYHDLVDKEKVHPTCFPTEASLAINPESARRILEYFQQAMALAQSEAVKTRVEKASICAYRALLSAVQMRLVFEGDKCRLDLEGLPPDLLEIYAGLCAKYQVAMEGEEITVDQYLEASRKLHAGLEAVRLENEFWRVILLPEQSGKLVEMTYKPTGRNVVAAIRALDRFRFEEWLRQGEGPSSQNIVPFTVGHDATTAMLTLKTADGSQLQRRVALEGEAIRFDAEFTAGAPRTFDYTIHTEYDSGSRTDDPAVVAAYVKAPEWIQANTRWKEAIPDDAESQLIAESSGGGAFAFFNHEAGFGVEQRFHPQACDRLSFFWSPSRQQVNLELFSKLVPLETGQRARFSYEVRYLKEAPPTEE